MVYICRHHGCELTVIKQNEMVTQYVCPACQAEMHMWTKAEPNKGREVGQLTQAVRSG